MRIGKVLYRTFSLTCLMFSVYFLAYTLSRNIVHWDFYVFYGSARNVLQGLSPYTYYGPEHLPFWYFPWVAWIFLPLTIFPISTAWVIHLIIGFTIAFLTMNTLANYYQGFGLFDRIFIYSIIIWMSWLAYRVGQMSFLVLGVAVLVIFLIKNGHYWFSGFLLPLLLIKPHLFIIVIPLVLWMGGRKTLLAATLVTSLLLAIETVITPDWIRQMLGLLLVGTGKVDATSFWGFATFPTLLGFPQNYTGTANMPITILLVAVSAFLVIRFRTLPAIPLLSFAMAASLFCAPRSYSYDLVLLIPAMIWLSEKWSFKTTLIWVSAALILFFSHFSTASYLLTILVVALCVYKAFSIEKQRGVIRSFWGRVEVQT